MTAPVVIPVDVALPLIRHRAERLAASLRQDPTIAISVTALAGIVEDLVGVVDQLAAAVSS